MTKVTPSDGNGGRTHRQPPVLVTDTETAASGRQDTENGNNARNGFPQPPSEKREGKLYGSPLLALPCYGASAVGAGTGESPGPEPAATRPWCL
jgi:hypothetical protein